MDNLSSGKMNFTSTGNSAVAASQVPRQSGGMRCQASPSVNPAKGPLWRRDSLAVSHASPRVSARFVLSGKYGASERVPQMRGLKIGSIRDGTGSNTDQEAASAREKNFSSRWRPSSIFAMDVAKDSLRKPGAPNASPGTKASCAFSRSNFARSMQDLAMACFPSPRYAETFGNA